MFIRVTSYVTAIVMISGPEFLQRRTTRLCRSDILGTCAVPSQENIGLSIRFAVALVLCTALLAAEPNAKRHLGQGSVRRRIYKSLNFPSSENLQQPTLSRRQHRHHHVSHGSSYFYLRRCGVCPA